MKLQQDNKQAKSQNKKRKTKIPKIVTSSRGPNLRSRRITYKDQSPSQQKPNGHDESIAPDQSEKKIAQQTTQKEDNRNEQRNSKDKKANNQILIQNQNQVDSESNLSDESQCEINQLQDQNDIDIFTTPIKRHKQADSIQKIRKKRVCKPLALKQIFRCEAFKKVHQIDFLIYFKILAKGKMFSTLLINEFGQIIFADRLGSEHFEGSLNNFSRNPIHSMILESQKQSFFEKVAIISSKRPPVVKMLIYSKNSKRRYSKASNEILLTNHDIFNRYLKCISVQLIPIEITISDKDQFEGIWNQNLIELKKPCKCILFKARLAKSLPNLNQYDLSKDKKIQKFLKYTRKKQAENDEISPQKQSQQPHHQKNLREIEDLMREQFFREFQDLKQGSKEFDNIYSEINDQGKHSKSILTRGIFNSGGGKQRKDSI